MSILICGGAGYIGSHVNKLLSKEGYNTIVFDNLVYGHREAVKWGRFVKGDLGNIEEIDRVFADNKIEAVIHLAAYAYVGESINHPEKYYYNNVVNTLNLLQVMKKYSCKHIIFSSTCATYGVPESVPITEKMTQNPINPYGNTKLMVERIFKDYQLSYGLRFVVLRYFNAAGADPLGEIGESHNPETHIIPLALGAADGKLSSFKVYGDDYETDDGSCVRDYIHVSDLAYAHLLSLRYLINGGKSDYFNLGNEEGTSVLEVLDTVRRVTCKDFDIIIEKRRIGDPPKLIGSGEKAKQILGWEPCYPDIETIVKHAWEWYKNATF